MLNLLKLKQEKAAAKEGGAGEEGAKGGKVIPAAQRRVQKDLKTGIEKNEWCDMEFPDPDDIMNFTVTLKPDEGFWKGGKLGEVHFIKGADFLENSVSGNSLCKKYFYHISHTSN